jgi:sigma-B regulation protein RsbU (phosphoserine phosphatase)
LSESEAPDSSAGTAGNLEDWFENAPCGHLLLDRDGHILRANRTFATWSGHSPQSLTGRPVQDLLPIAGKIFYDTHFAPLLHLQEHFDEVALDFVCVDGSRMPTLVNATEGRDADGATSFIRLAVFRTKDRRRYERNLLEARDKAEEAVRLEREISELREQFIAVLGHDMRNPLASIASGMRLLGKEPVSERGRRVIELVEGSVIRAAGLIDNVLDFARGRLGGGLTLMRNANEPLEPVLRQVVDELRSIAPDRVVLADYDLDDPVDCDRGRIGQLLSNLLGNALTHGAKDQPVRVSAKTDSGALAISVSNGGAPIPAATMAQLFQPFFRGQVRSNRDGLGLGLHIASEIAKAHGGRLDVLSNDAETRFTFVMPLVPDDIGPSSLRPFSM